MKNRPLNSRERMLIGAVGALLALASVVHVRTAEASRLKDIASIKGVRENQLLGYGLVVGLKGTGDSKKEFTGMSMTQMLRQMGVDVKTEQMESKNVAAVVVTANLPPFARVGQKIDVTISSIGDAKSLGGGTLLLTPLRGGDKAVYVVAQGALSVGGYSAEGGGSSSSKNHPTVGSIPNGGMVEKEVNFDFSNRSSLRLALHNADFTTAARVAKSINVELGGLYARARDSSTIDLIVPYDYEGGVVELIAQIERVNVTPDNVAKVIVNEKTGTIVVGDTVRISTVAIAHGNLTLEVKNKDVTTETVDLAASKNPADPQQKTTEVVKETTLTINEAGDKLLNVQQGATLGDLIKALNALGVTPRDLIAIMQSLKAQGALQAELEIQ
jgi:flagellar P-ring protein precursor FlgI